jgi:hypothetical protein
LAKATNDHGTAAKGTEEKVNKTKIAKAKKAKEREFVMSDELAAVLSNAAQQLSALEKGSTKATFEIGAQFQLAKDSLPKKSFGDWVSTVSTYTVRSAWNFCLVNEKLGDIKERIIEASVPATSLIRLAKADGDVVEAVLSSFEQGQRLTGEQIKTMIAGNEVDEGKLDKADVLDVPGVAGLHKVAARKVSTDIDTFLNLLKNVFAEVEMALEPLERNKAVRKGSLSDKIKYDCRHALGILNTLVAPLKVGEFAHETWYPGRLPEGAGWRKVQAILSKLGGGDAAWPERTLFVPWLQNEVLPPLRFVLEGTPFPEFGVSAGSKVKVEADHAETSYVGVPELYGGQAHVTEDLQSDIDTADVVDNKVLVDSPSLDPSNVVLPTDVRQSDSGRKKRSKSDMPEPAV